MIHNCFFQTDLQGHQQENISATPEKKQFKINVIV